MSTLTARQASLTVSVPVAARLIGRHPKTAYRDIAANIFPLPTYRLGTRIVCNKATLAEHFGVTLKELERRIAAVSE